MNLSPEEPLAGPWRVQPIAEVVGPVINRALPIGAGPAIIGVDGRSSSGKTTLSRRMRAVIPRACVVHTDDIAWRHSIFGWVDLIIDGILRPARQGRSVSYRPPAWQVHNRFGAIEVPGGMSLLIVEGVGAGRRELAKELDVMVWVQSDLSVIERRNAARIASGEVSEAVFKDWMAEEIPFLAEQRPWERADVIVSGTPDLPHDPTTEFVTGDSFG